MMGNTVGKTGDVVNDLVQSGLHDYVREHAEGVDRKFLEEGLH